MGMVSGVVNSKVNLDSGIADGGVKLDQGLARDGVVTESRKRRRRGRKRRKGQNTLSDDNNSGQSMYEVNQDAELSTNPDTRTTTKDHSQAVQIEATCNVRLKAENQRLPDPLERTTESGNEISRGMLIKKADPINEFVGIGNELPNLSLADVSDGLGQDIAWDAVSLESGQRKKKKRRRKGQNRLGDDTNLVQNINQVKQDAKHSMYPDTCTTLKDQPQAGKTETRSDVRLKAEHQGSRSSLERAADSGNKINIGVVRKKDDPIDEILGIDHTNVLSNLSLIPVSDGLKGAKSKRKRERKRKSGQQAPGSFVGLKSEHQGSVDPLERTLDSGNEINGGVVIKKNDPINEILRIDHTKVLSNLSLIPVSDGLKGTSRKKRKRKARSQSSESFVREESSIGASQTIRFVDVSDEANLCSISRSVANKSPRRKLLVLDINGLLADIVMPPPKGHKADKNIAGRAIFKRPFYNEFLVFCFERFDVGIWSSRSKKIIDKVVDYLLGDMKSKLLFCWNMLHCTQTSFKTLENKHKPLVFKELRKLWEKHDPDIPWEKGDYNKSNTVLLDDSPYKALLNPVHTAIFPYSFHYGNKNDNSLGPGGDLRLYLEGLARAADVRKYIEQHPFGQRALGKSHSQWGFYCRVLSSLSPEDTKRG